jgi:hypothetical protein
MKKKQSNSLLALLPGAIIFAVMAAFYFSGDGSFRYPCQDPSNFTNPMCLPPNCLAAEDCTSMVLNLGENNDP